MSDKKKILVTEDETRISQILQFNLKAAGYDVDTAYDGEEGLEKALNGDYDLILLDIMMPKIDGFTVCTEIRKKLNTPIIIVSAKSEEADRILGLDIGADDYVTKPFRIKELLARINANIRRHSNEMPSQRSEKAEEEPKNGTIIIRGLSIGENSFEVTKDGEKISLTKKEYDLLRYLALHKGELVPREEVLEKVWGYDGYVGDMQTVDVTMFRLRKKLETDTANPEYLFTVRGGGYTLR